MALRKYLSSNQLFYQVKNLHQIKVFHQLRKIAENYYKQFIFSIDWTIDSFLAKICKFFDYLYQTLIVI